MESLKVKCFRHVDVTKMDYIINNFSIKDWLYFMCINKEMSRIDMEFINKWNLEITCALKKLYEKTPESQHMSFDVWLHGDNKVIRVRDYYKY